MLGSKKLMKSLFSCFQGLKFRSESSENESYGVFPEVKRNTKNRKSVLRAHQRFNNQLSASDGNLSRREQNAVPGISLNYTNSSSVSNVQILMGNVIQEASIGSTNTSSSISRQPIRVINGSRPLLQSQVLLNTKTSQPFVDLVRDLGMSVRVPKQPIGNRLETLTRRPIQSYSQFRSELRAGQSAFYICFEDKLNDSNLPVNHLNKGNGNQNRNGKPIVKAMLGKANSNSSSELAVPPQNRRRSHTRAPSPHMAIHRFYHPT